MEDLSDASSESDDEGNVEDTQIDYEDSQKRHGSKLMYRTYSRASANVAILVVACWVMRVPVLYTDFIRYVRHYMGSPIDTFLRLIDDYVLPYLDPIERGLFPESMVKDMNRSVKLEVSPLVGLVETLEDTISLALSAFPSPFAPASPRITTSESVFRDLSSSDTRSERPHHPFACSRSLASPR